MYTLQGETGREKEPPPTPQWSVVTPEYFIFYFSIMVGFWSMHIYTSGVFYKMSGPEFKPLGHRSSTEIYSFSVFPIYSLLCQCFIDFKAYKKRLFMEFFPFIQQQVIAHIMGKLSCIGKRQKDKRWKIYAFNKWKTDKTISFIHKTKQVKKLLKERNKVLQ